MISDTQINKFAQFTEHIAVNAGKILLDYKDKIVIKKHKTDLLDIATSADYAAEQYIIEQIKKNYPDHSIYSEEASDHYQKKSDFEWVIDPLDGTKEYSRNIPYYFVLITLEHEGKAICSVGYQPETKRCYLAILNNKAKINNKIVDVSKENNPKSSFIHISLPNFKYPISKIHNYFTLYKSLVYEFYRVRSNPWDVEALYYVGMGSTEAFILPTTAYWINTKWWDVAAGIFFVEQAGGKVTDFYGQPIKNRDLTKGLIASNGKIHDRLLVFVKNYSR